MRIGIIAHLKHPIRAPFAGGLEAFTYRITLELLKRGHQVLLFASDSSDIDLPLRPILNDANYDNRSGIRRKVKDLASEYIEEHHSYQRLMMTIDEYDLDVIFNNSLHYIPITMAGIINTPMVTVLHTPPFYELNLAISAEQRQPVVQYVTVSKKNAESWANIAREITIIHNGIDVAAWEYYGVGKQDNYAVWFGRIHPDKGLEFAIKAAKIAGIKLKIAGGVGDKKYFKNKIEPLLDDNTDLMGLLDQTGLNDLIGKATVCLVTPVWQEPFGLVVAEAMACGTPIAGFEMGALPEIITDQVGRLVPFGDVAALSIAIKDASTLDRFVVHKYCEQNFDIGVMVDAYEQVLGRYAKTKLVKHEVQVNF